MAARLLLLSRVWMAQWGQRPGGGGGSGGPPDLDEIWRRFNRRLAQLFGGRGGGGGPSVAPGGRRFGGKAPLIVIALLILIWIASGIYIVYEGQRGVVLRFGQYIETTMPGPHWHLPYPIESVETVNVAQVRTIEIGYRNNVKNKVPRESLMLTEDENIVDIQFAVQYTIKNPEDYLFNNRDPDGAVVQAAETSIREVVGKSTMNFVLYEGREEVAARAQQEMQKILDRYGTGIAISRVTMQSAQPPEEVQAAFDDAVKANQDRDRLKNLGQAYANDVIPKARGQASRIEQEAEGYRQREISTAQGDASRFDQLLSAYEKAPQVTRERLYLDTVQDVLKNANTIVVDQNSGNSLLYLPLDKLLQKSGKTPVSALPATPESGSKADSDTQQSQSSSQDADRSRQAFRSRDRETR
ncbi:MAG TPA: FtsH protease activity modulator HflK [Burkholderiales bacterium]|nr:FtsH protease activity modulator HflK [Burkholderiales bacterium]